MHQSFQQVVRARPHTTRNGRGGEDRDLESFEESGREVGRTLAKVSETVHDPLNG